MARIKTFNDESMRRIAKVVRKVEAIPGGVVDQPQRTAGAGGRMLCRIAQDGWQPRLAPDNIGYIVEAINIGGSALPSYEPFMFSRRLTTNGLNEQQFVAYNLAEWTTPGSYLLHPGQIVEVFGITDLPGEPSHRNPTGHDPGTQQEPNPDVPNFHYVFNQPPTYCAWAALKYIIPGLSQPANRRWAYGAERILMTGGDGPERWVGNVNGAPYAVPDFRLFDRLPNFGNIVVFNITERFNSGTIVGIGIDIDRLLATTNFDVKPLGSYGMSTTIPQDQNWQTIVPVWPIGTNYIPGTSQQQAHYTTFWWTCQPNHVDGTCL